MPFQNLARTDCCKAVYRIYAVCRQYEHIRYLTAVLVIVVVVYAGRIYVLTIPCNWSIARVATDKFSRPLSLYHMKSHNNDRVATVLCQRITISAALTQLLAAEVDIVTTADGRVNIYHRSLFYLQIQYISDAVKPVFVFYGLCIESGRVVIFLAP